jgi:subfamily B ATP-binding cassette protein MsbA
MEEIEEAARIAYADEFIVNLPQKYEEILHAKGSILSGGQKQRLCVARAIVGNPPILVFDEATSSLDTEAEKKVQAAIEQATRSRTVLIIAHRLSTVLSSDKIIVLDAGQVVDMGAHRELIERCPRYKLLYDLQFNV